MPSSLVIMFTGYPWYPRGKVVKVGVCVTKLRHLEQILLPNVNDHATKLTLFDKDFHVPRLPILTRKKKGQSIFSLLCFHEALELVEVSNSILAILLLTMNFWIYEIF